MPLIKPRIHRVPVVRHPYRLQAPNRGTLLDYARFIGETPDYVLNQLIDGTLAKDRDFVAWRATQSTQHPQSANAAPEPLHNDADRGKR